MNKIKKFFMSNAAFPILTMMLGACVFTGHHMFRTYGFGLFQSASQTAMITVGMETGDYGTAIGYASGFLLARVLEGPLVGILDIGGSFMTGVGTGLSSLCIVLGLTQLVDNFFLSVLTGAVLGLIIGLVIIFVKKAMPEGLTASGTDIMMGVGNSAGRYLGPLVIIYAIKYSIPCGIGAIIGAAIMHKINKPVIGGALLGAMLIGAFF